MAAAELTGEGIVLRERTLLPGQGVLEGLGEVEEAPADDDIVVERHEETHLQDKQNKPHIYAKLFPVAFNYRVSTKQPDSPHSWQSRCHPGEG